MDTETTILIVDDRTDLTCMLAETLAERDWETHVAFNGHYALQMTEQLHPRVVLLGISLSSSHRSNPAWADKELT